ncbi:MAG: S-layer homology domain-containing protein [Holophagales bacterium]|nr:S-layer homology domain-containing protein [Holophagales bacterium]
MVTGATATSVPVSYSSTGSAGITATNVALAPFETINNLPDGITMTQYYLAADVASDTSFAGCYLWWTRQVTPAPAAATFSDVPTDHWAFRFVEALGASGITAGCGGGAFCPDNPVTRAQMAVFLASALGLNY